MLFNTNDLEELNRNIEFFHVLFLSENVGSEVLSRADRKLLKEKGVDYIANKQTPDFIKMSYNLGKLDFNLRDKNKLKNLTFTEYKRFLKTNPDKIPVKRTDYWALKDIKLQVYKDVKKLSNKIKEELAQHLLETTKKQRNKVEKILTNQTKGKQLTTEIIADLNDFLAKKTAQWMNHFKMISSYNMHTAYNYGSLSMMLNENGEQVKVYFQVHPDACITCKRLYIRIKDGQPKIFYLRALMNNGSNIGKKSVDYSPVVSAVHPHCRCKLTKYPSKTGKDIKFDTKTRTYIKDFK